MLPTAMPVLAQENYKDQKQLISKDLKNGLPKNTCILN